MLGLWELVDRWLTEPQFLDAVAVGVITPGPVVFTAAFVGYLVAGFVGSAVSSLFARLLVRTIRGPLHLDIAIILP
jgi:chromate transport protein ChrA